MSYLHGVEFITAAADAPIQVPDTAVIGLVGTAAQGAVNEAKLITSFEQATAEFGEDLGGLTIISALKEIFDHVSVKVVVVNVATPEILIDWAVTTEMGVDVDGNWNSAIYGSTFTGIADVVPEINAGLDLLIQSEQSLGVKPNILIAPGYSQNTVVLTKMIQLAEMNNAWAFADAVAASVTDMLTARTSGDYAVSSDSLVLCYPQLERYNEHESEFQVIGLSVFGAIAKLLATAKVGFWQSPSNQQFPAIKGTSVSISSSLTDATADTNLLNAQGIFTVFRKAGTSFRTWGNWSAAFPSESTTDKMIGAKSVRNAMREALEASALLYLDKGITLLQIQRIEDSVNEFFRTLVGAGAIIDGSVKFAADKNPPADIAAGKLVFSLSVTYSPSVESLKFEETVDVSQLQTLFS